MKILIVDDDNDKIAGIVSAIHEQSSTEIQVETVIDVIGALKKVEKSGYDILIIDLLLPTRAGEHPKKQGGASIVAEIERKTTLNTPKYIIGLTQYAEYEDHFSDIWNLLVYSPDKVWKEKLGRIIRHAEEAQKVEITEARNLPCVFVEGKTDRKIIRAAIQMFRPDLESKIDIKSDSGAGAIWVSNQIVAWAHILRRGNSKKYLKAIGLLDGDLKGVEARDDINRIIPSDSAKREAFRVINLSPDYARELIPIYAKGLKLPVTLEEMFPSKYWEVANNNDWLERRKNPDEFLKEPTKWNKLENNLSEHIASLGISGSEQLFLKKMKKEHKDDFAKYILALEEEERRSALQYFEPLINDLIDYFTK